MSQWYDEGYVTIAHGNGYAHLTRRDGLGTACIGRMVRAGQQDCPTCGAHRRTTYTVTLHDGTVETVIGRQAAMDRLVEAWRARWMARETR